MLASAATALAPPMVAGPGVEQVPALWWEALTTTLRELLTRVDPGRVRALAVDGTSGTVLLADHAGRPLGPALLYNDARAVAEAQAIARVAPRDSAGHGTASGLAKLLWLLPRHGRAAARVHTQVDWLSACLCDCPGVVDANNALKLGYDPVAGAWPAWLETLGVARGLLPRVVAPGTPIAPLRPALAAAFGLAPTTRVVAGTTDSTAAFIATGADAPGEAVTSLGSTLVMKVVAERPVFAPEYGVYSQPLGHAWLVGGGSNSGGAVLRRYFSDAELAALTPLLDPGRPTGLDYYPLTAPGERFPVNDPLLPPRLAPIPDDRARFLQGLLEGMARIEQQAYVRLAELGAPYPHSVRSVGGGARNPAWSDIRARLLGVPVWTAEQREAAYGSALLARAGASAMCPSALAGN